MKQLSVLICKYIINNEKINSIFVYGSLQRGMQNCHLLKDINGTWKKGYVIGTLINIGKGENYGFPAIKLDEKGSKIYGMILGQDLEKNLFKLDKFEGGDYKRVVTVVTLEDNSEIKAYTYQLRKKIERGVLLLGALTSE